MRIVYWFAMVVLLGAQACAELEETTDQDQANRHGSDASDHTVAVRHQSLETKLCGSMAGLQANAPWPMYGGCPTHAAQSSQYGPINGQKNWQRYLSGNVKSSPAIGADGSIYVGSDGNWFFKINPLTGVIIKQDPMWGKVKSSPAIGTDGTVYVGDDSGTFYAYDPNTLKPKWTVSWIGAVNSSPVIASDGTVYFGSNDFNLYAYRPDGTRKWKHLTGTPVTSSPAVGPDGTIYFGSDITLYALNPDGTKRWTKIIGFPITSSPALGRSGTVHIGAGDKLLTFDAATGAPSWERSLGSCTIYAPAIAENGVIYVGTGFSLGTGGSLYAVSPEGDILWHFDVLGGVQSTPIVDRAGNVYFGANDNNVYAVDATGQQIWKYPTLGSVQSSPALDARGAIVVGTNDNNLYSIGVGATRIANGGLCANDAECAAGLVCGLANGSRFGLAGTAPRACWVPACENGVQDPGETEVDCGGPCGSCNNVCSRACTLGSQVTPVAQEVLAFSKAAYIRASYGTYQVGGQRLNLAPGHVLRFEDRGDGRNRLALFEGGRVNSLRFSEQLGRSPTWYQPSGSPAFVLTQDVALSPLGVASADRLQAPAGAYPSRTQALADPLAGGVLSAWLRNTDPSAASAQTRAVVVDAQGRAHNAPTAWTTAGTWQRRAVATTASTTPITVSFSHKSGWPDSSFGALPAADFLAWGLQLEQGPFPSSYIPTADNPATRAADRLVFGAADVPPWIRSGLWQLDVAPIYASSEISSIDEMTLVAWEGGQLTLARDAAGGLLKITSGSAMAKIAIDWTKDAKMTVTLDLGGRTLSVRGATRGDGLVGIGSITIPSGRLAIGARLDGSKSAFARISEPRRVMAASAPCVADPDCTLCGDGLVNGSEACDTAGSSSCDSDCGAKLDLPVPCDPTAPTSGCGPGQVCGAGNGPAFGQRASDSFCWPVAYCGDPATRPCGPSSVCGLCRCDDSCTPSACGTGLESSCGTICTATCQDGQAGCASDLDCQVGSACIAGSCRPDRCLDPDVRATECGSETSPCGPCLQLRLGTKCLVQACGIDEYGNQCGVCDVNSACMAGNCVPLGNPPPPEATALAPATSSAAGALRGTFSVDEQGNAKYSIPIDVPPGRAGFQPKLSLEYNSAAGRSHVGDGWSIGGMMVVSRCNRTLGDDRVMRSVHFDAADAFCLNGKRLHLVPGGEVSLPYGAPGTEYRTKPDSFLRVKALRSTPASGAYVEPEYFEIKDNFGTIYRLGKTPDSRKWVSNPRDGVTPTTLVWFLNEIEDASGNVASFIYRQEVKEDQARGPYVEELTLQSVQYPPYHRVDFNYKTVHGANFAGARYWAGVETNVSQRLADITTYTGNQLVLFYRIVTEIDNNAWLPQRIEKCTADACLEPITLVYGSDPPPDTIVHTTTPVGDPPAGADTRYWQLLGLDVNSDGREDLFYSRFRDDASGLPGYQKLRMVYRQSFATGELGPEVASNLRADCDAHQVFDFDLDGHRDDVFMDCRRQNPDDPTNDIPNDHAKGLFVAVHTGNGQFEHRHVSDMPTAPSWNKLGTGRAVLADLNGDGRKDLLRCTITNSAEYPDQIAVWSVMMQGFDSTYEREREVARINGQWCFEERGAFADLDGDGAEEGLVRTDAEVYRQSGPLDFSKLKMRFGLITWDGTRPVYLPDAVRVNANPAVPEPGVFGPDGKIQPNPINEFLAGTRLDANGDGLPDAVVATENGLSLVLNTGVTFKFHGISRKPAWFNFDAYVEALPDAFVLDREGDGRDELYFPVKSEGRYAMFRPLIEQDLPDNHHVADFRVVLTDIPYQYKGLKWSFPALLSYDVDGYRAVYQRSAASTGITFDKIAGGYRSANKAYLITAAKNEDVRIRYDRGSYVPTSSICQSQCPAGTPSPTVAEVDHVFSGVGQPPQTYTYEEARVDPYRRNYLGFSKVTRRDGNRDSLSWEQLVETTYHNGPYNGGWVEFAGLPKKLITTTIVKDLLGVATGLVHQESTFHLWFTAMSDGGQPFHYLAGTQTEIRDADTLTMQVDTSSPDVDTSGNSLGATAYWGDGRVTTYSVRYAPEGGLTQEMIDRNLRSLPHMQSYKAVDARGAGRVVMETKYDGRGRPTMVIRKDTEDPALLDADTSQLTARGYTAWTYHPFGNVETETRWSYDATVQFERYDYDASFTYMTEQRNVTHASAGLEPTRTWFDPATGKLRWVKAPDGNTITTNFDGFGRVREVITSGGVRTSTEYLKSGLASWEYMGVRTSGPAQPTTTTFLFSDDQPARVVESRPGQRNVVQAFEYDGRRRLSRATAPAFSINEAPVWTTRSIYEYDTLNRPIRVTDPITTKDGGPTYAVTSFAYIPRALSASEGNAFSVIAPNHAYVQVIQDPSLANHFVMYDGHANPIGSLDAANVATRNAYDPFDRLVRVAVGTPSDMRETAIVRDSLGNATSITDPDRGVRTFEYDGLGLLKKEIRNGVETTFAWDGMGRPVSVSSAEGTTAYTWDVDAQRDKTFVGKLVSDTRTSPEGSVEYSYEYKAPDGMPSARTMRIGTQSYRTAYTYAGGLLSTVEWPNGFKVKYGYDASGTPIEVRDASKPITSPAIWSAQEWDPFGQVTKASYGAALTVSTSTDPRTGMVRSVSSTGVSPAISRAYEYDVRGWLTKRTSGGVVEDFVPDAVGRLQNVLRTKSGQTNSTTYTYDGLGSTLTTTRAENGSQPTTVVHGYDYNDRPRALRATTDGHEFFYDAHGNQRLRTGPQIVGGRQELTYASSGLPRFLDVGPEGSPTTHTDFLYGPDARRAEKTVRTGSVVRTIRYPSDDYMETLLPNGSSTGSLVAVPLPDGTSLQHSSIAAQADVYAVSDPQGSWTSLVTGAANREVEFTPYGASSDFSNPNKSPWGFAGAFEDSESGLVNLGARAYDPVQGRFLSPDPIMLDPLWGAGSPSSYSYGRNAPQSLFDPTGLDPNCVTGSAGEVCDGFEDEVVQGRSQTAGGSGNGNSWSGGWSGTDGPGAGFGGSWGGDGAWEGPQARSRAAGTEGSVLNPPSPMRPQNAYYEAFGTRQFDTSYAQHTESMWYVWKWVTTQAALGYVPVARMGVWLGRGVVGVGRWAGSGVVRWAGPWVTRTMARFAPKNSATVVNEVAEVAAKACFPAGTKVVSRSGLVSIESVEVGDEVLAYDALLDRWSWKPVVQRFVHDYRDQLVTLNIDGESIDVTANHPFCVVDGEDLRSRPLVDGIEQRCAQDGRWLAADQVREGDLVATVRGVADVESTRSAGVAMTVYNLEVEAAHTYVVSDVAVLVHNKAAPFTRALWQVTKEGTDKALQWGGRTISRHKTTKLWWSKDTAGHGGSAWKVFKEEAGGLRHFRDADKYGDFIVGKHKGPVGEFIPWSQLAGK